MKKVRKREVKSPNITQQVQPEFESKGFTALVLNYYTTHVASRVREFHGKW